MPHLLHPQGADPGNHGQAGGVFQGLSDAAQADSLRCHSGEMKIAAGMFLTADRAAM